MSSFALISVEKDYKVDISEGKVTLGRGPYLQASTLLMHFCPLDYNSVTSYSVTKFNDFVR